MDCTAIITSRRIITSHRMRPEPRTEEHMCPLERHERRLAAILATDVVGSSRLMEEDEEGTLAAIQSVVTEIIEPAAARHRGRLVKTTGDGALLEFASPVEAVLCAVEAQAAIAERASPSAQDHAIQLRIGVNMGDTS